MNAQQGIIIGVCGGSGSGKSSLADQLQTRLAPNAVVLRQDWYYRDGSHLRTDARARQNFDHPDAIDLEQFAVDLVRLRSGQRIVPPDYCFETHSRRNSERSLGPVQIIIAEGLFLFQQPMLSTLYNLKIFIHTDGDVRLLRRLQRDMLQRGRSLQSISSQYLETVKPMHEQHVEPNRHIADLIVQPGDMAQLSACADQLAQQIKHLARPDNNTP